MTEAHECTQAANLATISANIAAIKESLEKIETTQDTILANCQAAEVRSAKYPSPEEVGVVIKKVDAHDRQLGDLSKGFWIVAGTVLTGIATRLFGVWH